MEIVAMTVGAIFICLIIFFLGVLVRTKMSVDAAVRDIFPISVIDALDITPAFEYDNRDYYVLSRCTLVNLLDYCRRKEDMIEDLRTEVKRFKSDNEYAKAINAYNDTLTKLLPGDMHDPEKEAV